jgi:hypothetical protein
VVRHPGGVLVCRDRQQAGSYDHVRCSGFDTNQISRHRESPVIGGEAGLKQTAKAKTSRRGRGAPRDPSTQVCIPTGRPLDLPDRQQAGSYDHLC